MSEATPCMVAVFVRFARAGIRVPAPKGALSAVRSLTAPAVCRRRVSLPREDDASAT